jgi:hypothetical protein
LGKVQCTHDATPSGFVSRRVGDAQREHIASPASWWVLRVAMVSGFDFDAVLIPRGGGWLFQLVQQHKDADGGARIQ